MKRVGMVLLTSLLVAAASAQEFKPELFGGLQWRNIGPERGGRSLSCTGSPGRTKLANDLAALDATEQDGSR